MLTLSKDEENYAINVVEKIANEILRNEFLPDASEGARFYGAKSRFEKDVWNKFPRLKGYLFFDWFINPIEKYIIATKRLPNS